MSNSKTFRGVNYHPYAPWLFLTPYIIIALTFFLYPLIYAGWLSFHQTDGPHSAVFVGLDNFKFIFSDPSFYKALKNTTIYAIASICIQLPLSLGLAILLNNSQSKLKNLFRLLIFSPNLVGQIFVGVLFSVIFTPRYGIFNIGIEKLIHWGLDTQWLSKPGLIMPALIIVSLWMYVGYNMIYFLAALQTVDKQLVEAAQIDGASPWQVFLHVTLPQIRPVAVFVVIMSTIGSYQLFELPFALLKSSFGVDQAGLTIVGYLYDNAFNSGDLGTGAAIGWILAFIIFVISIIQLRATNSPEDK